MANALSIEVLRGMTRCVCKYSRPSDMILILAEDSNRTN